MFDCFVYDLIEAAADPKIREEYREWKRQKEAAREAAADEQETPPAKAVS